MYSMQEDGVNLIVTATDKVSSELVDTIVLNISGTPGDPFSPFEVATGNLTLVELTYAFRIVCLEPFYGPECDTVCFGRDDSSGHFSCSPEDGSIVCLPGYRNETTNCTECDIADGCCKYT